MKKVHVVILTTILTCLIALIIIAFIVAKPTKDLNQLILTNAFNNFSLNLFKAIINQTESENVCFSAPIASLGLSSILLGVNSRSASASQLFTGLSLYESIDTPGDVRKGFREAITAIEAGRDNYVYVENLILIKKGIEVRTKYSEQLFKYFRTSIKLVDFKMNSSQINEAVNNWIRNVTHGKMKGFEEMPTTPDSELVLLNALYLQKNWRFPFQLTHPRNFQNSDNILKSVPFLHNQGVYRIYRNEKFTLVEIPYESELNFFLILPHVSSQLDSLIRAMSVEDLKENIRHLESKKVNLFLPKITFETEYDLAKVMPSLGVNDLFTSKAKLSGISKTGKVRVSKAIHKVLFEIEDKPSTSKVSSTHSLPEFTTIEVHRPFAFFVGHRRNGAIYVMGKVNHV